LRLRGEAHDLDTAHGAGRGELLSVALPRYEHGLAGAEAVSGPHRSMYGRCDRPRVVRVRVAFGDDLYVPTDLPESRFGTTKLVTIALPNYNGRRLLEAMLPSIFSQNYSPYEVLVVDDASTDDSVDYLGGRWPAVRVVELERQGGVTAALNHCWRNALGVYVALLNTDVELDRGWLGSLVEALEHHPDAVSATGKTLNYRGRELLDGAGDIVRWSGSASRRGFGQRDVGQYDTPEPVFGACAGMSLYRRSAFEAIGPFDEDFWAFHEDSDWAFRAQLAGLGCRYVPSAIAYHMGSETIGSGEHGGHRWYVQRRNTLAVVLKNYPASSIARHGHDVVRYQLACLRWAWNHRQLRWMARVWMDTAVALPRTIAKRREVQRSRRIGNHELELLLDPSIPSGQPTVVRRALRWVRSTNR
ncbi:MAG: glycosyltransferase family 2 protein, partial [Sciscionella sp.]